MYVYIYIWMCYMYIYILHMYMCIYIYTTYIYNIYIHTFCKYVYGFTVLINNPSERVIHQWSALLGVVTTLLASRVSLVTMDTTMMKTLTAPDLGYFLIRTCQIVRCNRKRTKDICQSVITRSLGTRANIRGIYRISDIQ